MGPTLRSHRYGKQRVRLTHLDRSSEPHRLTIVAVGISLEGDFAASYTEGDNRRVVATDSMRNTVYVLARERGVDSIEELGAALARHFVESYPQVASATIELEQELWSPIASNGASAADAFERRASEVATATAVYDGERLDLVSGLDRLDLLKSARSGFVDFVRDRYTTLPDVHDRLFATSVRASWRTAGEGFNFEALRADVRRVLVESFARHDSLAVQQTLHAMAEAVFACRAEIVEITLALPNRHHLLVDLSRFGLDNPNRVFVATDEPFGRIEATLTR